MVQTSLNTWASASLCGKNKRCNTIWSFPWKTLLCSCYFKITRTAVQHHFEQTGLSCCAWNFSFSAFFNPCDPITARWTRMSAPSTKWPQKVWLKYFALPTSGSLKANPNIFLCSSAFFVVISFFMFSWHFTGAVGPLFAGHPSVPARKAIYRHVKRNWNKSKA